LKRGPFSLVLSQTKYFYNYFSFFIVKILVWRTLTEAKNCQFTTKITIFLAIVGLSLFSFSPQGLDKDILIDKFWFVLMVFLCDLTMRIALVKSLVLFYIQTTTCLILNHFASL
jgi:hypothetical protein